MRLTCLSLALAALVPMAASAQTQVAPGVTVIPGNVGGGYGYGVNAPGLAMPGLVRPVQPQPQPAPEPAPAQPSVEEKSFDVPSAKDQGLSDGPSPEQVRQAMADAAARSTPRQKGQVISVPTLANPVGKDRSAQGWLANWELALSNIGVSQQKFWFEANRLSRSDFEAWASRQLRFRQSQSARMDVLERPAVDLLTPPVQ